MYSKKEQQPPKAQDQTGKPRFRIEKLEERIAPTHKAGHYPPGQYSYGGGGCWHGGKWHGPCND